MTSSADSVLVTKNIMSSGFKGTVIEVCSERIAYTVVPVLGLTTNLAKSVFLYELMKYTETPFYTIGLHSFKDD